MPVCAWRYGAPPGDKTSESKNGIVQELSGRMLLVWS